MALSKLNRFNLFSINISTKIIHIDLIDCFLQFSKQEVLLKSYSKIPNLAKHFIFLHQKQDIFHQFQFLSINPPLEFVHLSLGSAPAAGNVTPWRFDQSPKSLFPRSF